MPKRANYIATKTKKPASIRALKRFEEAVIAKSWMGSREPQYHADILIEYQQAKNALLQHLPDRQLFISELSAKRQV